MKRILIALLLLNTWNVYAQTDSLPAEPNTAAEEKYYSPGNDPSLQKREEQSAVHDSNKDKVDVSIGVSTCIDPAIGVRVESRHLDLDTDTWYYADWLIGLFLIGVDLLTGNSVELHAAPARSGTRLYRP